MLVWELLGAVMGAGYVSGREIAAFFAKYGLWGYAGAVFASAALAWLADTAFPLQWHGRWQGCCWKMLLAALLIATGGAMLSGAGEAAALVLPFKCAYHAGMFATFVCAWLLANKTKAGLAWVSWSMVLVFGFIMLTGLKTPSGNHVALGEYTPIQALMKGLTYGGFNAALLVPLLRDRGAQKRRALLYAGGIMLMLLFAGIRVLQRNPALIFEEMPFVRMLQGSGKWGYYISALCLYLALLSTLTACIRGLGKSRIALVGIVVVSLAGFKRVVDGAYPLLGCACMIVLTLLKFRNCWRKAFISAEDML